MCVLINLPFQKNSSRIVTVPISDLFSYWYLKLHAVVIYVVRYIVTMYIIKSGDKRQAIHLKRGFIKPSFTQLSYCIATNTLAQLVQLTQTALPQGVASHFYYKYSFGQPNVTFIYR